MVSFSLCLNNYNLKYIMQYFKEFNIQRVWTNLKNCTMDLTSFFNVFKQRMDGLIHSEDWQIRLSFMLFLCTIVNIVLIGLAWRVFGDTITNLVYNKPKSPARRLDNMYRNDENMEELRAKKIQ